MQGILTAALRIALLLCPGVYLGAEESRAVTWDDLLQKKEAPFDDPFAKLSEDQLLDLGMVARISFLLESE